MLSVHQRSLSSIAETSHPPLPGWHTYYSLSLSFHQVCGEEKLEHIYWGCRDGNGWTNWRCEGLDGDKIERGRPQSTVVSVSWCVGVLMGCNKMGCSHLLLEISELPITRSFPRSSHLSNTTSAVIVQRLLAIFSCLLPVEACYSSYCILACSCDYCVYLLATAENNSIPPTNDKLAT